MSLSYWPRMPDPRAEIVRQTRPIWKVTSDRIYPFAILSSSRSSTNRKITPLYMKLTEVMDALGEPYELVFVDDGSRDNTFTSSF